MGRVSGEEMYAEWIGKYQPHIDRILTLMGIKFEQKDYDRLLDHTYKASLVSSSMLREDIMNLTMQIEIIRTSIIAIYKENYKAPYGKAFLNFVVGAALLLVLAWVATIQPNELHWIALNAGVAFGTMYKICQKHLLYSKEFIERQVAIDRLKRIYIYE